MSAETSKKAVLYAGAPFFCYPWKPLLNAIWGQTYERAYTHFRRDHQDPSNLLFHTMCLALQLSFNYSLLSEGGKALAKLTGGGKAIEDVLVTLTSAAWSFVLLRARGAPLSVRLLSVAAIALAHSQREKIAARWKEMSAVTGVLEMLAVQVFVINKATSTSGQDRLPLNKPQLAKLVLGRWLFQALIDRTLGGCLAKSGSCTVFNVALAAWLLKVCQDPFGAKSGGGIHKNPFFLGIGGWLLAFLTDQPWLYLYSGGFLASMAQGVAHHYAGEEGTLPQLANVADELSHTTFFPNLLLHSIHQSLTSGRGLAIPAASSA